MLLATLAGFSMFTTIAIGSTMTNEDQMSWTLIVALTFGFDVVIFSFVRVLCLWIVPGWLVVVFFGVSAAALLGLVFFCSDLVGPDSAFVCNFIPL